MTTQELAAETARLRGWELLDPPPDVLEQPWRDWYDGPNWKMAEHDWDPANDIIQAQELVEEVKRQGLVIRARFMNHLLRAFGQRSGRFVKVLEWWLFEADQPRLICEAFIAVMREEANG